MMDLVDKLDAIEQIRLVKARYFRFVDTKQWDDLRALFTEDATLWYVEAYDAPQSLDDAMIFISGGIKFAVSIHRGYMPEIEILDADRATAIWPMADEVYWSGNDGLPFGYSQMTGAGHYHETYRRENGVWKIASLKLTRLRRLGVPLPFATLE